MRDKLQIILKKLVDEKKIRVVDIGKLIKRANSQINNAKMGTGSEEKATAIFNELKTVGLIDDKGNISNDTVINRIKANLQKEESDHPLKPIELIEGIFKGYYYNSKTNRINKFVISLKNQKVELVNPNWDRRKGKYALSDNNLLIFLKRERSETFTELAISYLGSRIKDRKKVNFAVGGSIWINYIHNFPILAVIVLIRDEDDLIKSIENTGLFKNLDNKNTEDNEAFKVLETFFKSDVEDEIATFLENQSKKLNMIEIRPEEDDEFRVIFDIIKNKTKSSFV